MIEQPIAVKAPKPPDGISPDHAPQFSEQYALHGEKMRGPAERIIASIEANAEIPAEDKAFLIAKIRKTGFEGIVVNAHDHFCKDGAACGSFSITKLY